MMDVAGILHRVYFRNEGNVWVDASVHNSNDDLVRNAVIWSVFFTSMYPFISWVLHTFFAGSIQHLVKDEKRFKDLVGYLYSLVHHLVVVPFALAALYKECMSSDEEWAATNFAVEYAFLPPYCFGYLMGDLLMYAIPAARKGKYDMLLHHVLGLGLIACACVTTPPVVRFQIHMILLETSSIFFCFAWFARNFGYDKSLFVSVMEAGFALSFFVFRIVHLCAILWALRHVLLTAYPLLSLIFAPLLAMQFYWFFLIVTYEKKPKKND